MFLSYERLVGKSLTGHLLKDNNWLEEGVQPARRGRAWEINPGGLCCLSDSLQAGFQAVVQIHVRVGVFIDQIIYTQIYDTITTGLYANPQ